MHWARVPSRLVAMMGTLGPSLRVIALVYAGLGGMLALALVGSLALVPVSPVLQQVAEPARLAVNNLVHPSADAVTTFFGGGPLVRADPIIPGVQPDRTPASFAYSEAIDPDVTIADEVEARPLAEPPVVAVTTAVRAPAARTESAAAEPEDEIVGIEPVEISLPHALEAIVQPAAPEVFQIASQDVPKALPTLAPTETALQVKARKDVENQAAIDAAKAAQTRARAEADAANNAAIAARKAATAMATPTSAASSTAAAPGPTAQPSAAPTSVPNVATPRATPQSTSTTAQSANQTAIDAAKVSQARAKAEANTANQAAIDAAKRSKAALKGPATPSAQPTPRPSTPAAEPMPTTSAVVSHAATAGGNADNQAAVVSDDDVDDLYDEASLDDAPLDRATTLAEGEAA